MRTMLKSTKAPTVVLIVFLLLTVLSATVFSWADLDTVVFGVT